MLELFDHFYFFREFLTIYLLIASKSPENSIKPDHINVQHYLGYYRISRQNGAIKVMPAAIYYPCGALFNPNIT